MKIWGFEISEIKIKMYVRVVVVLLVCFGSYIDVLDVSMRLCVIFCIKSFLIFGYSCFGEALLKGAFAKYLTPQIIFR